MTVLRQPLGVVGVITAWNFPAYNPARAWAAALAAGCTVVARASEFTPLTAMAMTQVLVGGRTAGRRAQSGQRGSRGHGAGDAGSSRVPENQLHRQRARRKDPDGRRLAHGHAPVPRTRRQRAGDRVARRRSRPGRRRRDHQQVPQQRPGVRVAAAVPRASARGRRVCRGRGAPGRRVAPWQRARSGHPGGSADQCEAARPRGHAGGSCDRSGHRGPHRRAAPRRTSTWILLRADGAVRSRSRTCRCSARKSSDR